MVIHKRIIILIMIPILLLILSVAAVCEHVTWDCPECGKTDNTGNYCGGCAHPAPWITEQTTINTMDDGNDKNAKVNISIGDIITFGRYEQDGNSGNGPEKIEWIVLDYDEESNSALLLSRYGLEAIPYNKEFKSILWEKCTIREWLNEDFFNAAFKKVEQSAILMTEVNNSAIQGFSGWTGYNGNNTQDKVFLLSYTEANRYLDITQNEKNNVKARVAPTTYAIVQGAFNSSENKTEDETNAGCWWLRSPGFIQNNAACVLSDGSLYNNNVNRSDVIVRPAFWANMESDIFNLK